MRIWKWNESKYVFQVSWNRLATYKATYNQLLSGATA